MGGMIRLLATIGAKGASKFLKRRKQLGGGGKAAKSASAFVKRRKQISDARKKQRMSKEGKDAIKFGAIAATGVGASAGIKRNKPVKKAMGGEAAESVGKATVERSQREIQRKRVDDMLDRVYGTGIKPKKKPKDPKRIVPKKKPINPKTRKPKGIGFKGPKKP